MPVGFSCVYLLFSLSVRIKIRLTPSPRAELEACLSCLPGGCKDRLPNHHSLSQHSWYTQTDMARSRVWLSTGLSYSHITRV